MAPPPGEWFPKRTLGALPEDAARRWGAREALAFQGRRWSFGELSSRIDQVARGLLGLGVELGEHVALWMVNRPEFIDAAFAVLKIGAVLVPVTRHAFGPLVSGYGMSEFGAGAALSALDSTEEQCVEASGYPAPGYEIRVIDPATGRDQPVGMPGELLVRSYMTMQGYYKRPEETAKTIDPEGWVHTGDMGLVRPDGHVRFLGRYKDMLKIGGENVDPMEVEAFLMRHPAINLAAVVAFPDARLSEVGVAFVRLEPGETLTEADVVAYCRGKIASFKIPRRVIFVGDFPMTGSGKIQKAKLRESALAQLSPE